MCVCVTHYVRERSKYLKLAALVIGLNYLVVLIRSTSTFQEAGHVLRDIRQTATATPASGPDISSRWQQGHEVLTGQAVPALDLFQQSRVDIQLWQDQRLVWQRQTGRVRGRRATLPWQDERVSIEWSNRNSRSCWISSVSTYCCYLQINDVHTIPKSLDCMLTVMHRHPSIKFATPQSWHSPSKLIL